MDNKDIKDYLHLYLVGNNCDTETGGCINSLICNLNDRCQRPNGIEVYIFSPETLTNGWLTETKKQLPSLKPSYRLTFDNYKKTIESGYLPILRPLSDMTEEEAKELFITKDKHLAINFQWTSIKLEKYPATKFESAMKFEPGWKVQAMYRCPDDPNKKEQSLIGTLSLGIFSPLQFTLLLSKGFDLFDLIEAGLAIDKTKLKVGKMEP